MTSDGFDSKLVAVSGGDCKPIEAFAEVCEELIAALATAEVNPSDGLMAEGSNGGARSEWAP